jgi:hypothetical protein
MMLWLECGNLFFAHLRERRRATKCRAGNERRRLQGQAEDAVGDRVGEPYE